MFQYQRQLWPARYELLDGFRGLACLAVLLHHLGVVALGHYAVMTFFVISGYCITAAAQAALRQGLPFSGFMWRRVRRIYPPYLLAILLFVVTRLAKNALTAGNVWAPSWLEWVQNLTLTQWLSLPFHPVTWPSDNPTLFVAAFWSLNYEEQFYLVMGLALLAAVRWKIGLNRTVLALFVLGLAWNFTFPGGWVTGLFIEYWAHFALGSAVYFVLCEAHSVRARSAFCVGVPLLGTFCIAQVLLAPDSTEASHRVYIELAVLSVFAVGLVAVRPLSAAIARGFAWKPIAGLGAISYSLYLVHQFNLSLVERVVAFALPLAAPAFIATSAKVLVHIAIATAFWYLCERPFLSKRTVQKSVADVAAENSVASARA